MEIVWEIARVSGYAVTRVQEYGATQRGFSS